MPYVVVRKGCTFVLLLYYRSYWEFEEHSINFNDYPYNVR